MGIEIPGYLQAVASVAVGSDWPDGDETSLWRLGDAWAEVAEALGTASDVGDVAARGALSAIEGEMHDSLATFWGDSGGVADVFDRLISAARELGESCDATATEIEYTKLSIIAALIALAVELASMAAAAIPTVGLSTVGAAAAEVATTLTVRMLLRQLLIRVVEAAAVEAASAVFSGLAIQLGQMTMDHRKSVDVGKIVTEGRDAFVKGAANGVLKTTSATSNVAYPVTGAATNPYQRIARNGMDDAVSGASAAVVTKEVTGGDTSLTDITSGAFGGATGSVKDGLISRNDDLAAAGVSSNLLNWNF
ncbi:hypothetical protein [Rhodococcus sp. IEGM 1379]|uniref:WXG100-like domain-containing protein n=1 Tax=Rhodococcus sp. IEGM 1379 TaxID=3047086 RepID=UPI0024B848EE|nr:hypothetical protein [Rhodococcus sp. IEGM 1379]MDI9916469.1 hypothetical protein [Rhodococcus sp. IEGM 1379]